MHYDDISVGAVGVNGFQPVVNGVLARSARGSKAAELVEVVFIDVFLYIVLPLLADDDNDVVDLGVVLKNVQTI